MPYAIGTVIYGLPMNERQTRLLELWREGIDLVDDAKYNIAKWNPEKSWPEVTLRLPPKKSIEVIDEEYIGFERCYTGDDRIDGYCGVVLDEFDECDSVLLDKTRLARWKPTPEQKRLAREMVKKIHPKFRKLADPIGVYIVWSSS